MKKFEATAALIYDGECPLCRNYMVFSNVRKNVPNLQLISARDDHEIVRAAWAHGINLNDEFALFIDNRWYTGAAVMEKMASLGNPSLFDRMLNFWLGKNANRDRNYKVLVRMRKLLLHLLGRAPLKPPAP